MLFEMFQVKWRHQSGARPTNRDCTTRDLKRNNEQSILLEQNWTAFRSAASSATAGVTLNDLVAEHMQESRQRRTDAVVGCEAHA